MSFNLNDKCQPNEQAIVVPSGEQVSFLAEITADPGEPRRGDRPQAGGGARQGATPAQQTPNQRKPRQIPAPSKPRRGGRPQAGGGVRQGGTPAQQSPSQTKPRRGDGM